MPRKSNCVGYIIDATKWLPVLLTCTIFIWSWYAYTILLVLDGMETILQQVICIVVFHILYVFSFWSYLQTIFAPSQRIPSKFYLSPEVTEDLLRATNEEQREGILAYAVKKNDLPVACRSYSGGIRYCEKCNLIKPDRCHHCSICGVCILRMDHHCPWINNCVSFTNYKFFVLFLGYTLALCAFVGATTLPYFLKFWSIPDSPYNRPASMNQTELPPEAIRNLTTSDSINFGYNSVSLGIRFHILFLFFVSTMLSLGVMFLFCYHIHLLLNNRSTLESFRPPLMIYGPDRNAFNLGKRENIYQSFGRSKLLWFIPVFTTLGSGLVYDQRPQLGVGDEEARQELLNPVASNNSMNNGHNRSPMQSNNSNNDTEV